MARTSISLPTEDLEKIKKLPRSFCLSKFVQEQLKVVFTQYNLEDEKIRC